MPEQEPDYKKMYFTLFNKISKAIELLQSAQRTTEELYISASEDDLSPGEEH